MKKKDFFTGLVMLLLSGAIFAQILRSPPPPESSGPGPFFLPGIVALVIAGLSIALMVRSSRQVEPGSMAARGKRMGNRILWIMIWCFGYAITVERLGYLLSTAIVTFALLAYFNRRKWFLNVIFSLLTPASIYLLFASILKVPLPKGWFGF